MIEVVSLRTEWLESPLAVDEVKPRFSWQLKSQRRGVSQTAWRVLAAGTREGLMEAMQGEGDRDRVLWDSERVAGRETSSISYGGSPLRSRTLVYWAVQVWDEEDKLSRWSEVASFQMGLLDETDWEAEWISRTDPSPLHDSSETLYLPPASHYRRDFSLAGASSARKVDRALLYFSALGVGDLWLNGERVSEDWFEPGWSDYGKRAYYRAHDVTGLIHEEQNCLGVVLGDGWYSGYVAFGRLKDYGALGSGRCFYGKTPAFLAQLEIHYADGGVEKICSDSGWKVSTDGPIREADFLMGESFDARRDDETWSMPAEKRSDGSWGWSDVILAETGERVLSTFHDGSGEYPRDFGFRVPGRLQAYPGQPIRVTEEMEPPTLLRKDGSTWTYDFRQNFAGVVRIAVKGGRGAKVRLRFAERLHDDGTLMTENLRTARATDFYTLKGSGEAEVWTPRFTYHGFQYLEVSGLEDAGEVLELLSVEGLVLHNDTPLHGDFSCSDPVMTRFALNAIWTQRANFIEVPTDCPQRDERLGWTGDALAYVRTSCYFADTAAFFTKWMNEVEEAQLPEGPYPDYCPFPMVHDLPFSSAWMDAGIVCPWTIWKVYGDRKIVERHWNSMTKFMDWRAQMVSEDGVGIKMGNPLGDWLSIDENTSGAYIDTCFHAFDCACMAEMATAMGRDEEADVYRRREAGIRAGFAKVYLKPDGALSEDSQTAYALALWAKMVDEEKEEALADTLAAKIRGNGLKMATGFVGCRILLPMLSRHGYHDLAADLFQSRSFPSWGYEVVNGATSVWERWDSYTKEFGFNGRKGDQNAEMNSFCHYSFGSVMEWAYQYLAGIRLDGTGCERLLIKPCIPPERGEGEIECIRWVRAGFETLQGAVRSDWSREGDRVELSVVVPPNTEALVLLPVDSDSPIRVNGLPVEEETLIVKEESGGAFGFAVPSGEWTFLFPMSEKPVELERAVYL